MPAKPHLLVIDDDVSLRTLFTRIFHRDGYDVDATGDGRDGLDRILAEAYDVIILDLMMTGVSGFEVIDRLLEHDPALLKRVIVATGASLRTLEKFDVGKVHALVRKPFDMDEFLSVVRSCATQPQTLQQVKS